MKVFLLRDVAKIGRKGEIVETNQGYANNFLIPKGFGRPATTKDIQMQQAQAAHTAARTEAQEAAIRQMLSELDGATVTVVEKANPKGVLFAKLHVEQIATAINQAQQTQIESDWITIKSGEKIIKEVGQYELLIRAVGSKAKVILEVQ